MKRVLFFTAFALALAIAGASLAQNSDAIPMMLWSNWREGIRTLWIPLIFSVVIVGFGTLALQRIKR